VKNRGAPSAVRAGGGSGAAFAIARPDSLF